LLKALLIVCWTTLVLYPKPWDLAVTIQRAWSPPVDAASVVALAQTLPDDPTQVEAAVRTEIVPYAYDWVVYDEPWYFASPSEALRDGRGDCESQAVVLASLLEAKGIPYRLQVSFDHIWVEFPQKKDNAIERDAVAVIEHVDGQLRVKKPDEFDLEQFLKDHNEAHVVPMPASRKALLLIGIAMILLWDWLRLPSRVRRSTRRPAADSPMLR
jgi:hypothetical protein